VIFLLLFLVYLFFGLTVTCAHLRMSNIMGSLQQQTILKKFIFHGVVLNRLRPR